MSLIHTSSAAPHAAALLFIPKRTTSRHLHFSIASSQSFVHYVIRLCLCFCAGAHDFSQTASISATPACFSLITLHLPSHQLSDNSITLQQPASSRSSLAVLLAASSQLHSAASKCVRHQSIFSQLFRLSPFLQAFCNCSPSIDHGECSSWTADHSVHTPSHLISSISSKSFRQSRTPLSSDQISQAHNLRCS